MNLFKFQRCLGLALALLLAAVLPVTAMADTAEPTELVATDVTLDETRFEYTGQEIRPNVTVRVGQQLLTLDRDYTLEFRDHVEVGTGAVVVTGLEAAGYTGTVEHPFYIEPRTTGDDQTEPTEPEQTQPEETKPEETQPEESKPEQTEPEETKPEETQPVSYKITKGNGAVWHKNSGKDLSFTTDGNHKDFQKLLVGGKTVNSSYYTVKEGTVVTLKAQFLQALDQQKHTITLVFADGEAEGTFRVSAPADESNPKTGDSVHLWMALLFVSLTGMAGIAFSCRKKFRK
jgi:hypothetical protein